jgi:hypothetical protein
MHMKLSVALNSCGADAAGHQLTAPAITHLWVRYRVAGCVSGGVQVALGHAMLPSPAAQAKPSAKQLPEELLLPEFTH